MDPTPVDPTPAVSASAAVASVDAPAIAEPAMSAAEVVPPPPAEPTLLVTARWLVIHERPDRGSLRVGLSRRGQHLPIVGTEPVKEAISPCKGGWFAVKPRGFVCAGDEATLKPDPVAEAAHELLPDAALALPFRVGSATFGPRYRRLPSPDEQSDSELDLARLAKSARAEAPLVSKDVLAQLHGKERRLLFTPGTYAGQRIAWAREISHEGRAFVVTPDGAVVPKDRVSPLAEPATFGVDLSAKGAPELPIAFVVVDGAHRLDDVDGAFVARESLTRRLVVAVDGPAKTLHGQRVLAVRGGGWVPLSDVAWVERPKSRPMGVGERAKWVRASVGRGTLLALEGDRPMMAFAMSPGAGGVGKDVKHGTPLGRFMVAWKHLTADMSGEENGIGWSVDEVPWVAYYVDGYAVHGAYWHDGFGRPKSHGCLNLAPSDARRLFEWMEPALPSGWYAVAAHVTARPGTIIDVAP